MNRRTIIVIASVVAVAAAVLPLAAIAIYARHSASEYEKQHLQEYAGWTLMRTERSLGFAREAITKLEREQFTDCSPAHIERMRRLTMETRSVEEIGYFVDGKLACTSWGLVHQPIERGTPDVRFDDGFSLYLRMKTRLSGGMTMNALSRGNYNALMLPDRMIDVLTDTAMTLGIAALDGRVIAVSGSVPPELLTRAASRNRTGKAGHYLYSSIDDSRLRAFAISDYTLTDKRADNALWYLVPIGLATSTLLVGLVLLASRQRLSPRMELALAVKNREFITLYQPIIELETGLCVGAEALVRWERTDGAPISPEMFIPLAEETGLIEPLTDIVIERVVSDLATWLGEHDGIHIAINISSADMQSGRFLAVLAKSLADAGVAPGQIWLEATERGFMNAAAARATIERAREAGHIIAIDDFGTGYSSLSLLETLPLDTLKIDKSFVDAIGTQAATSVVIPHIIEMGHGLNFKIVAEGVETEAQEAYLREAGVEFVQGWRYSKALTAEEFRKFHQRTNAALG